MVLCYWFAGLFHQQRQVNLTLADKTSKLSSPVHLVRVQEQQTQLSTGLCKVSLVCMYVRHYDVAGLLGAEQRHP